MNISSASVKRPVTTLMISLVVIVFGLVSLGKLPIDLLPDFELPIAVVIASYEGVGPQEMENLVTRPLEEAIATVGNIENVSSVTSEGQSIIIAQFSFNTDMDFAALEMREKVDLVKGYLPDGVSEPMVLRVDPNAQAILQLSLSNTGDLAQAQAIAEDLIKPRLERIEGVASVDIRGGYENQILIQLKNEKLQGYGITPDYLAQIIAAENLNLPGGTVNKGNQELTIRTVGEFETLDEIRNLRIPLPTGATVQLKEIADVEMKYKELTSLAKTNGENSIIVSVQKQSGTNTVQVANAVSAEIEKIQEENKNLDMQILFDQSDYIEMAIDTVKDSAIQGAILAVLVLLLFLREFRPTLIIATSIPVSIIATFAVLYFSGITLNLMTLGGLALGLGMLVDNSIVVLENIFRYRENGYSSIDAAQLGAKEVGMAVTASTLTNVAVFLPIVFMEGITSTIFKELALTVTVSLMVSLVVAVSLIPMLSSKLLSSNISSKSQRKKAKKPGRISSWLEEVYQKVEDGYRSLLAKAQGHRFLTVLVVAIIFVLSLIPMSSLGREFLPQTDEGLVTISVSLPAGAELKDTEAILTQIESELEDIPEIEMVFSTAGSGSAMSMSLSGRQTNVGTVNCILTDIENRQRTAQEVADEIRNRIYDIPGAEKKVSASSMASLSLAGGGAINIQIKGDDIDTLKTIGDDVCDIIKTIDGTREVESSLAEGIPEVQIRVDRTRASQYGLTAAQIASTVRGTISGMIATRFKYQGDEIDVVIQGDESISKSIANLEQMMISTPAGIRVPLGQVAEVVVDRGPVSITRDGQVRMVTVSAQIVGRDLGSVSRDIEQKLQDYDMPEGYSYELAGENEEMVKAFKDLTMVLILAVILVYMILAAQFESLVQPFTIMLSVPLGLVGGILALAITGRTINVASLIGLIMLAGIVVNNTIVLIDFILTLRREGMERDKAIIEAGPIRLRPVLMTTLTTVLGLLPMAFATGEGAELEAPLAIALIGGLVLSTVITLIFIPVVYSLVDDMGNFFRRKVFKKTGDSPL